MSHCFHKLNKKHGNFVVLLHQYLVDHNNINGTNNTTNRMYSYVHCTTTESGILLVHVLRGRGVMTRQLTQVVRTVNNMNKTEICRVASMEENAGTGEEVCCLAVAPGFKLDDLDELTVVVVGATPSEVAGAIDGVLAAGCTAHRKEDSESAVKYLLEGAPFRVEHHREVRC